MVVTCNFRNCGRNKKTDQDHSFFMVPKDPAIREIWAQFAGWTEVLNYYHVCEDHFDPQMIWKRYPRPLLVTKAVPTIERCVVKRRDHKQAHKTSGSGRKQDENASPSPGPSKLSTEKKRMTAKNTVERIIFPNPDTPMAISSENSDLDTEVTSEITPSRSSNLPRKQPKHIFTPNIARLSSQRRTIATSLPPEPAKLSTEKKRINAKNTVERIIFPNPETPMAISSENSDSDTELTSDITPPRSNIPRKQPKHIFTPNTTRLSSQRRTIAALRNKINRLKQTRNRRPGNKKKTVTEIKELIQKSSKFLSREALTLFATQLRLSGCKKYNQRYTDECKDIALSIMYHSPKVYTFLRKIINLPSKQCLRDYHSNSPLQTGLNEFVLLKLKESLKNAPIENRVVSVLYKEIHLSKEIHYDDHAYGFRGFDIGDAPVATTALVTMIAWLNRNSKQVVGHWFLGNTDDPEKASELLLQTIDRVNETGLIVKAVVCDLETKNKDLANLLNVSPDKPFFERNNSKIFVVYDPLHLFNSLRNDLLSKKLLYKGGIVDWQELVKVYQLSKNSKTPLNLIPRISDDHFNLTPFSKTNVVYAAQVFSHSMYAAHILSTIIFPEEFPFNSTETYTIKIETKLRIISLANLKSVTSTFVLEMDKLFDSLNSSLLNQTVPDKLNYAITKDSEHENFLHDMDKAFQECLFLSETGESRPPCLNGFRLTINSILQLADDLRNYYSITELCTSHLNQDPVENVFAVIRQQHGCSQNLSPKQFQAGLKRVLTTQLSKLPNATNCQTDTNFIFAKLSEFRVALNRKWTNASSALSIPTELNLLSSLETDTEYIIVVSEDG